MKVKMTLQHFDAFGRLKNDPKWNESWEEEFDSDTTNCLANEPQGATARHYAECVVEYFNSTLKKGEIIRNLVKAGEVK